MRGTLILAALALAMVTSTLPLCKGRGNDSPATLTKRSCCPISKTTASCPGSPECVPAPAVCPATCSEAQREQERRDLQKVLFASSSVSAGVVKAAEPVEQVKARPGCCPTKASPLSTKARHLTSKLVGLLSRMKERATARPVRTPGETMTVELTLSRKVTLAEGKIEESTLVLRLGPGKRLTHLATGLVEKDRVSESKVLERMPLADEAPVAVQKLVMPQADQQGNGPLSSEMPRMPRADEDPRAELAHVPALGL